MIPLLLPSYIQAHEPSDLCRWLGTSSQREVSWKGWLLGVLLKSETKRQNKQSIKSEEIGFGEISQTQKDKYCMISLYMESKLVKYIEAGSRMVVARDQGKGKGEAMVKSKKLQFCQRSSRDLLDGIVPIDNKTTL